MLLKWPYSLQSLEKKTKIQTRIEFYFTLENNQWKQGIIQPNLWSLKNHDTIGVA